MGERIKKMWEWIKEHKKEIIITGAVSIVSAFSGIALYKEFEHSDSVELQLSKLLPDEGNNYLDNNVFRHHDGAYECFMYEEFPLAAMGKFGEYLAGNIPELPNNPVVVGVELSIADD